MELTYHRKGDYLFPNLTLQEEPQAIGKYGMLRRTYLKEYKKNLYQSLLMSGKLDSHLQEIEQGSAESDGEHDGRAAYEVPGSRQRDRSDGVDSTHEQPDTDGGGNRTDGVGIQLSKETTEQDLNEAEEEAASAFSLPELPTVDTADPLH